jgi:tetratricopeptide (TPR) repeat protein
VLYGLGLMRVALDRFNSLAAQPVARATLGVQTAALACLTRIHARYPTLQLSREAAANLPALSREYDLALWKGENVQALGDAAVVHVQALLADGAGAANAAAAAEVERLLPALPRNGPYHPLVKGLWAMRQKNYAEAIPQLQAFLKFAPMPESTAHFVDEARLMLGRAYHQSGKFAEAAETLKLLDKDSNYTVRVLNELAWSYVMKNQYADAIGVATGLQKGGLARTFTPEALIVMAMSFNELCQYPSAFRSVRFFYRNYRAANDWLSDWYAKKTRKQSQTAPYAHVLQFLETKNSSVPMPVLSEWLRSPVFTAHQDELNLILDEAKAARQFAQAQTAEARALYRKARELLRETNRQVAELRKEKKPVTPELKQQLEQMRVTRAYYGQFRSAVLSFRAAKQRRESEAAARRKYLVQMINWDLDTRSVRMLSRLRELIETAYLIQVEIYNGASEDIVWKNAHPGYQAFVDKVKAENQPAADKVLDWGPVKEVSQGGGEVWEDELDSMRATLSNNCDNKDRYLNVQMGGKGAAPAPAK